MKKKKVKIILQAIVSALTTAIIAISAISCSTYFRASDFEYNGSIGNKTDSIK